MHFELTPRFSAKIVIGIKKRINGLATTRRPEKQRIFMQDFFSAISDHENQGTSRQHCCPHQSAGEGNTKLRVFCAYKNTEIATTIVTLHG